MKCSILSVLALTLDGIACVMMWVFYMKGIYSIHGIGLIPLLPLFTSMLISIVDEIVKKKK